MRRAPAFVLPLALASLAGADHGQPRYAERPGVLDFSGQLIVRPARNLEPHADKQARERLASITLKYYPEVDEYVVSIPADLSGAARGEGENALADELLATGLFQYAVPNWICHPLDVTPNDPLFSSEWHHQVMRSPAGWAYSTGSASTIVAVTDTGIDLTHQDLAPKRVPGFDAYNDQAETDGGSVADINGHGTHVAGCAAAFGNNGVGVAGVNWDARIMMIRVAVDSSGGAYYDDLMQGARWAVEHGAKTVSASYSGVDYEPIQTTGAYIKSIGGLYFYAAGNDQRDLNFFDWPDVVVVGASEQSDNKAWFSAFGQAVDVFAPGQDILSTCNGGGYCYASGTSMATPVANGVASLIWSINPSLTPDQVQSILYSTARDLGPAGEDAYWGFGRVDVLGVTAAAAATLGPAAPTALDDAAVAVGAAVSPPSERIDVLANDSDLNGDAVTIASFDPASARGGSVARSVGTGPGGRDQLLYTPPAGAEGSDTFAYTISDGTGRSDTALVTVTIYPESAFRTPENPIHVAPGVGVDYYVAAGYSSLPNFPALTPYAHDLMPEINFPSTGGDFSTSGRADNVGAVYTGFVSVPATGFYTFTTSSDDGSQLFIGDSLVADNNGLHGMQDRSGTIALRQGVHALRVTFWENGGGAGVIASYEGPGVPRRVIPAGALSHAVCPADFNGDGFTDFFDYDAYVGCFESGDCPPLRSADFNADGFADFFDYDDFIAAFEAGC